jgi:integrase
MGSLIHVTAWERVSIGRRFLCAFARVAILIALLVVLGSIYYRYRYPLTAKIWHWKPERGKLEMQIRSREAVSFSWKQTKLMADKVKSLGMDAARTKRYAMLFILASASGLRCGELFALKMDDLDFKANNTIRVDESVCTRTAEVGQCKNAAAYRLVLLADAEGQHAMKMLKRFVGSRLQDPSALVFQSNHKTPLRESNVLREALHLCWKP